MARDLIHARTLQILYKLANWEFFFISSANLLGERKSDVQIIRGGLLNFNVQRDMFRWGREESDVKLLIKNLVISRYHSS